jgi:DNA-binding LacI/PurR family transcriptional regulator
MRLDIATGGEGTDQPGRGGRIVPQELYYRLIPNHSLVRSLATEQPRRLDYRIAFVFTNPAILDPDHALFEPLLRNARAHAGLVGIDVVSFAPMLDDWLDETAGERCRVAGVEGIVVFGGYEGDREALRARWPGLPAVFVEDSSVGTRSAEIAMDNEESFARLVRHLWEGGRTRIATITGRSDARPARERLTGYERALRELGLRLDPDFVERGDWSPDSGYRSTQRLLRYGTPPDAIACACDVQAVGALCALEEAGLRCPDDVAITGFDDAPFARSLVPTLTTVRQPAAEMGVAAIDTLAALLADPELPPPTIVEKGTLLVRESSTTRVLPTLEAATT